MAILMPAAILATLPVLFLLYRRRSAALYPTLAGFALFVIALAVTLIVEVPIGNQIEAWTVASLPAKWYVPAMPAHTTRKTEIFGRLSTTWVPPQTPPLHNWHRPRSWAGSAGFYHGA
jgi:hypothetical protein